MTSLDEAYQFAVDLVRFQLQNQNTIPTEEQLATMLPWVIDSTCIFFANPELALDQDRLMRAIRMQISIYVPPSSILEDTDGHEPWLRAERDDIDWFFWNRYRGYLLNSKKLPTLVVSKIDDTTDDILSQLESPRREGAWSRKGLVAGQVQSGKTANYTGLICKAIDSGYKLVVVLAGLHNDLRAQTQIRLDEGLIGRDSANSERIGVGIISHDQQRIISLTNRNNDGDFKAAKAESMRIELGNVPIVVVIKKNVSVLKSFINWVQSNNRIVDAQKTIANMPALIIDDEADNASINTKNENEDPSRINELIRSLIMSFEKSAYVGYTATPFANLFINDDLTQEDLGQDLFPRSFIVALRPPSSYLGPADVFGMQALPELELPERSPLPIVRRVRDSESWVPDKHKSDCVPGPLPLSLKEALQSFILSVAARMARSQFQHNSMLIHVTRFNSVQAKVRDQVIDLLSAYKHVLKYGEESTSLHQQLRNLWESDFIPTRNQMLELRPDYFNADFRESWLDISNHLTRAVDSIEVRTINGTAKEVLDYNDSDSSLSVIAIGGDKLSRGLTLEGLTVSYYLRASKMYDTLLQMGRWFGYRPDYADVCRLYTTDSLASWYNEITTAAEELWQDFEYMSATSRTPMDFGLRVRRNPNGLLVTSPNKMKVASRHRISYAGTVSESIIFDSALDVRERNLDTYAKVLNKCKANQSQKSSETYLWQTHLHPIYRDIKSTEIIEFFETLIGHPHSRLAHPQLLNGYIKKSLQKDRLLNWTVVFIDKKGAELMSLFNDTKIGHSYRAPFGSESDNRYTISRLIDPKHEGLDLSDNEYIEAMSLTEKLWMSGQSLHRSKPDYPAYKAIRSVRPMERGLLLLYRSLAY